MGWPIRVVRLASNPHEDGLWCTAQGLSLAGQPLVTETEKGFEPRPLSELEATLRNVYGQNIRVRARDYLAGLNSVAKALSKSDLPLAMIGSVLLNLPDIPIFPVKKYSDDEERDWRGRWTDGSAEETRQPLPVEPAPVLQFL